VDEENVWSRDTLRIEERRKEEEAQNSKQTESKRKANRNQTERKNKANRKQTESKQKTNSNTIQQQQYIYIPCQRVVGCDRPRVLFIHNRLKALATCDRGSVARECDVLVQPHS
jgi:hypothetical protein